MELNEAFEAAGALGRAQIIILIATSLMNLQTGFTVLENVFLAKTPPYHCGNHSGYSKEESVPLEGALGGYATCTEYAYPGTGDNQTRGCGQWEFNTEVAGRSIVSDWSLVCGKDVLPGLAQTMVVAGFGIGSLLAGPVSDKFGRRYTIIVALVVFNALGLSVSLAQSYVVFVILRFLVGSVFKAIRIPVMNLLFESLIPEHRAFFGVIPTSLVSVGLMLMSGIAYLVRDWRYLNIVLMVPSVIMMLFAWMLPESVSWLLSQNKPAEAEKTMQKIAAFNKANNFPSPALSATGCDAGIPLDGANANDEAVSKGGSGLKVLAELFRQPTVTVTVVLSWNWLTCGLTYFGFALSTGGLAGNPYLNFFLSSLMDFIALIIVTTLLKRLGTMKTLLFGFVMLSVTLLGVIVIDFSGSASPTAEVFRTIFAFLGRFFTWFAAQPSILMMSDLFPTPMRNTGTAIVHLVGNVGGILAPQLLYLDKYISNISWLVMLGCCLLSSVISLLLPETVGYKQPETPEDLRELFANNRLIKFGGDRAGRSETGESAGNAAAI